MRSREEGMNCTFDQDLLFEFAIGEIEAEERRQVESHLAACAACRASVVVHRQLARDLADLPEPAFPIVLEDTLVRASIQACKAVRPRRAQAETRTHARPYWVFGLGGLLGFGVLALLIVLLWPGRISSWGPVDRMVGGGVGQGLGLLDGILRWFSDLRSGWEFLKEFAQKLAPVQRAARVALGGIGGPTWAALALGVVGAAVFLWRIASAGQKKTRSVDHA
jgi:hypothetical protein